MKYVLIGLLKFWRKFISPLYGDVCKYYPTCSAYALEAVTVHGAAKGSWLAARRLGRCHPLHPGGFDPVPGHDAHPACCQAHSPPRYQSTLRNPRLMNRSAALYDIQQFGSAQ